MAIFVRDPIERFVSAYLDKAVGNKYFLQQQCCQRPDNNLTQSDCTAAQQSIQDFYKLAVICDNPHWRPQNRRIRPDHIWNYINFVGHMETVAQDAERLLRRIGVRERYGASGWNNASIF